MSVENLCRSTLQEMLDHGSLRSKAAVHHLRVCGHCRAQFTSFAHAWSQMGSADSARSDDRFADQVFGRIEHRARRRQFLRGTVYVFASMIAATVAFYYAGAEIYQNALVPVWQVLVSAAVKLPTIAVSLYTAFKSICTGPVVVALAAGVAVVWVAMLDRVASYIRLHRA